MSKKKKVLIVDDEPINRKLLKALLKKMGIDEVIEASNGVEALQKLSPDISLILLDILMKPMDGIEFMNKLRMEYPEYRDIPIFVQTTDESKKTEAELAGAQEVFIKPLNTTQLSEAIINAISNRP